MLRLDPEAFSTRWYKIMVGDCSAVDITTVCSDKWKIGAVNSLIIAVVATVLATAIGTLAALGLSRSHLAGRRLIMAFLISPMIVPLIITAAGMFLFYAKLKLVASFAGVILAHTVLGLPFVVITVTATLIGFDYSLTRAAQSLGGSPAYNFFKVQLPLIAPGSSPARSSPSSPPSTRWSSSCSSAARTSSPCRGRCGRGSARRSARRSSRSPPCW